MFHYASNQYPEHEGNLSSLLILSLILILTLTAAWMMLRLLVEQQH